MENLNERCLYHINTFLKPHDWLRVSQVSRLWKQATLKNWEAIDRIEFYRATWQYRKERKYKVATTISTEEAISIVLNAAPFIKTLATETTIKENYQHQHVMIGDYYYKVPKNFKIDKTIKLLTRKATQITELDFEGLPSALLVKYLFKKNNITKLSLHDNGYGWYQKIPTHGIEELYLNYENMDTQTVVSFEGRFPNLKKLTIELQACLGESVRRMLSEMLPYVPGLKSLELIFSFVVESKSSKEEVDLKGNADVFSEVLKLSQLEELSLDLINFDLESPELFLKQLPICCPKLRVLKLLDGIHVDNESLQAMLSLPQLESFECPLENGFPDIELPEMKHLTELKVFISSSKPILTGFFEFVKKVPQLKKLRLELFDCRGEKGILLLICGVAIAATSLGKEVLVSHLYLEKSSKLKKLRITNKCTTQESAKIFEMGDQVLELSFPYNNEEILFDGVDEFVRNNLPNYRSFVL